MVDWLVQKYMAVSKPKRSIQVTYIGLCTYIGRLVGMREGRKDGCRNEGFAQLLYND